MKKIIKVILVGLLLGIIPAQVQAIWLPTPCALVQKYPRLASFAAIAAVGLSVFSVYKWLSQRYSSSSTLTVQVANDDQRDLNNQGLQMWQDLNMCSKEGISAIAMHPSGDMFALSYDLNVQILDQKFATIKSFSLSSKRKNLFPFPERVRAFAFHPTKPLLAMQCGLLKVYVLYVYNYQTEELIEIPTPHKDSSCFDGMAFSPDGKLLVTSSDEGRIIFWKIDEQNPMQLLLDYEYKIDHAPHYSLNLSFNRSGTHIAIGSSMSTCQCCMVIDVASKEVIFKKIYPGAIDVAIAFHPIDESVVAVTYCDVATETVLACQWNNSHNVPLHSKPDKSIEIINIDTGDTRKIKHTQGGSLIAFSHDGTKLACRNNNSDIEIYDSQTGERLFHYDRLFREFYASILFDKQGNCITSRTICNADNHRKGTFNLHIISPQGKGYQNIFRNIQA